MTTPVPSRDDTPTEVESLRRRVAQLEEELAHVSVRANAAIAAAQDRAYWLDRWHLDLNALMKRPGADQFRAVLRGVRAIGRVVKRVTQRLRTG